MECEDKNVGPKLYVILKGPNERLILDDNLSVFDMMESPLSSIQQYTRGSNQCNIKRDIYGTENWAHYPGVCQIYVH